MSSLRTSHFTLLVITLAFNVLVTLNASGSVTPPLRCEDGFSVTASSTSVSASSSASSLASSLASRPRASWLRFKRLSEIKAWATTQLLRIRDERRIANLPFDEALFHRELAYYQSALFASRESVFNSYKLHEVRTPETAEAKLALFEASATADGQSILQFEAWLRSAPPWDLMDMKRAASRIDFKKPLPRWRVTDFATRLYLLSRSDPRAYRQIWYHGVSKTLTKLIVRRLEIELANEAVIASFDQFGQLKKRGFMDKVSERVPNIKSIGLVAGFDLALQAWMGFILLVPQTSALSATHQPQSRLQDWLMRGLPKDLKNLEARIRRSAMFDLAEPTLRRSIMVGLLTYALVQTVMGIWHEFLPGYDPDHPEPLPGVEELDQSIDIINKLDFSKPIEKTQSE